MDFEAANRCAENFLQNHNKQVRDKLTNMCIPYLKSLKKRFGFVQISTESIENELASDAVSDAILAIKVRKLPFSICLQNTFRDLCRKQIRIIREHDTNNIMGQCDIEERNIFGGSKRFPAPPVKAENDELVELARGLLENHEEFSKRIVYQKTRGSTYPEMADIFKSTSKDCKRVYWHDMGDLREKLNTESEVI